MTRCQAMELVFELGSLDAANVAKTVLASLDLGNEIVKLYGRQIDQAEVPRQIRAAKKLAFNIETSKGSIHFATVTAYKLHLLEIRENVSSEMPSWDALAQTFIGEPGFIQAFVSDVEYSYWQSAYDPIQYDTAGRSYLSLPMISNGLPAPLEQLVIDVSCNPSRRVLRAGYVEMIGHLMWLSSKFWALVGEHRRENILDSYQTTDLPNGVVRVVVPAGPFVDETTKVSQAALRRSLFE